MGNFRSRGSFEMWATLRRKMPKATYKASFPYQPVEVFITTENEEGNCTSGNRNITSKADTNKSSQENIEYTAISEKLNE